MRTSEHRNSPVTVSVHRSRMRAYVQLVGGVLLGLGLAAAVGLDPGLPFAVHTPGTDTTLLRLGLLPEDPDATADPPGRSCPPHR